MMPRVRFVARWICGLCAGIGLIGVTPFASDAGAGVGNAVAPGPLAGDSLYQLSIPLETQRGTNLTLSDFRGRPLLITMFYTQCTAVCPILTSTLQRLDRRLTPPERTRLSVLMVSFDAENDTAAALAAFAAEHRIDDARWVLARATVTDVRTLAAALGIRYRKLPDGSFNHSSIITLLDSQGVIRSQSSELTRVDDALLNATAAATRTPHR